MNKFARLGVVTTAVSAFLLAAQSAASALTVPPLPAPPSLSGVPVFGGLLDSLVGIATGSYYGAAGAAFAVLNTLGLPI
jgi:hypothetical protein